MLITGLVFVVAAAQAAKHPAIESSEIEMNEYSRIIDDDNNIDDKQMNNNQNGDEQMPVNDQISVLSRQLKMLTERRQEDYRMLERSLHSYVQKHLEEHINVDIKKELKDLRWAIESGDLEMEIVSCNEMRREIAIAGHYVVPFIFSCLRVFFSGFNVCELSDKRKDLRYMKWMGKVGWGGPERKQKGEEREVYKKASFELVFFIVARKIVKN